jgi:hypothetical protein
MCFRELWRRITTSQRTREREAAAQRECALKEDFARRTQALESQILLLRAENRALLNSVLGIAGIPPIMVTDPPDLFFARTAPPNLHDGAHPSALSSRQRADVWPDERSAVGVGDDARKKIPRTASRAPENRENSNSAQDSARDDSSHNNCGQENGAASPSTIAANETSGHGFSRAVRAAHDNGALAPEASAAEAVAVRRKPSARLKACPNLRPPMRRRSWHQIYRMLELESSRRKADDQRGTT